MFLSSHHTLKWKYIILYLMVSDYLIKIRTQQTGFNEKNILPFNEDLERRTGQNGISLERFGETYLFDNYWNQLLIVKIPKVSDFDKFVDSIEVLCNSFDNDQINKLGILLPQLQEQAKFYQENLHTKCAIFEESTRANVREMIDAAFKFNLPHPSAEKIADMNIITSMGKPDFSYRDIRSKIFFPPILPSSPPVNLTFPDIIY